MNTRGVLSFDYTLRRFLRHKANCKIREGFLSELLKQQIKIKYILDRESNRELDDDMENRADLLF